VAVTHDGPEERRHPAMAVLVGRRRVAVAVAALHVMVVWRVDVVRLGAVVVRVVRPVRRGGLVLVGARPIAHARERTPPRTTWTTRRRRVRNVGRIANGPGRPAQAGRVSGLGRTMSRITPCSAWYASMKMRSVRTVAPYVSNSSTASPSGS